MASETHYPRALRFLIGAAAFVIFVAGMRAAEAILVPFLLAVFLSVVCSAPLRWLEQHRVPTALSVVLIMLMLLGIGGVIGTLVGTSVVNFTNALPEYQVRLETQVASVFASLQGTTLFAWLQERGVDVSEDVLLRQLDVANVLPVVARLLSGLTNVLANTALILVTMIFILLEMSSFPEKAAAAFGSETSVGGFRRFTESVRHYLALKTLISLATGVGVAVWLTILGVDYPLLWGLLAFLLNYIPNIGSLIAALPAVLFSFIQQGTGTMILAAIGYLVVNTVIANFIEPRVMGRGVGLSTLVVFLSLVFWGWVLGPVGMLLSVPLTMVVKIALESSEDTRHIAILLGSRASAKEAVEPAPESVW